jgi:ABC-type multidrug transport system fused ATPase/permease subunit
LVLAAERQIKQMRNELYKSIIRQDYAFFDKNTAGELNAALIGYEGSIKKAIFTQIII